MLRDHGATFLRNKGSHRIWKLTNGNVVSYPVGHRGQSDVSKIVLARIRSTMKGIQARQN